MEDFEKNAILKKLDDLRSLILYQDQLINNLYEKDLDFTDMTFKSYIKRLGIVSENQQKAVYTAVVNHIKNNINPGNKLNSILEKESLKYDDIHKAEAISKLLETPLYKIVFSGNHEPRLSNLKFIKIVGCFYLSLGGNIDKFD